MNEIKERDIPKRMAQWDYQSWKLHFYRCREKEFKHLRFGQAFLNTHYPSVVDSELFYAEDDKKAESLIYIHYIDSDTIVFDREEGQPK